MKLFFYTLLFSLLLVGNLSAQNVQSGEIATINIATSDINGDTINLFNELDAGRTVIIDFFTTWCGPCWAYHESGLLDSLYTVYGPNGENTLRVFAIESDSSTTLEDLQGIPDGSYGDWTADVHYNMIDNHVPSEDYGILGFPTVMIFRPNRTVMNFFNYKENFQLVETMITDTEIGAMIVNRPTGNLVCGDASVEETFKLINTGNETITNVNIAVEDNGVVNNISMDVDLPLFTDTLVTLPAVVINGSIERNVSITSINSNDIEAEYSNSYETDYNYSLLTTDSMTIFIGLDYYPDEFSWELKAGDVVLHSQTYTADVGELADLEHGITIPADIPSGCLDMVLTDGFGDGLYAFLEGDRLPYIIIKDADGNVIKDAATSDYLFEFTSTISFEYSNGTGVGEIPFNTVSISPSPANDYIQLEGAELFETVRIFNLNGQLVKETFNTAGENINIYDLSSGVYMLEAKSEDSNWRGKFVKM